jgi:hypothetical protein
MDVMILINARTLAPKGLQIGFPNSMVSFFQPWGPIQGHKVQHLLWEYLLIVFHISLSAC